LTLPATQIIFGNKVNCVLASIISQEYDMPHLTVHALEGDLAGREAALAGALTDSIAAVYGEWARERVTVQLIGLPAGRWAVGGRLVQTASPAITLGVREAMFARPDADEVVRTLIASLTDAAASAFGEQSRARTTVELVATPTGRTGVGGRLEE
jgi:phenylpyruvate tautomerase PptA (4-oxalocrotonate tautomerase family)